MDNSLQNSAEPSEDFLSVFKDRYSDISFLSQGGMGKVFSAHDNILDKRVAIKILSSSFEDDRAIIRFQREAKTASKLTHQGIVQTLDFGITPKNFPYIIMDFVEGQSLDELLSKEKTVPEHIAVAIAIQVADAMAHAHSKEIIHRDLKTANIIVSNYPENPHVTVIDFGLAKQEEQVDSGSRLTRVGSIIGTPLYMSPEQANGKEGDERSDIYSLGCVLFKMLTGSTPFEGNETITLIRKKIDQEAPQVSSEASSNPVSSDLESLIAKSIKRAPADRHQTMKELKEDLEYSQVDKSLQTSAFAIPKFKKPNVEKAPVLALCALLGCVIVFAAGSVIASSLLSMDNKPKLPPREFKPFAIKDMNINHFGTDQLKRFLAASQKIKDSDLKQARKAFYKYKPKTKAPRILGISLKDTTIDGSGLKYLSRVPIKRLDLTGTDLKPESFEYIKDIKTLKSLILRNSFIDNNALSHLKNAHNLVEISLEGCRNFDNDALKFLSDLNLKIINLVDTELNDEGVRHLSKIKSLERIHFDKTDISDESFEILKNNREIKDITITRCSNITKKGIEKIATYWPKIKHLDISDNQLTAEDLTPLHKLRNLRVLALIYLPITDEDTKWISQNKHLYKLGIGKCQITDKGIEELTKLQLTAFAVYECKDITKEGIDNARKVWVRKIQIFNRKHKTNRTVTIIGDANLDAVINKDMTGMFINSME